MNKLFLLPFFFFIFPGIINTQFEEISQKFSTSCISQNIISLSNTKEYFIENKSIIICENTTLKSIDNAGKINIHLKNVFFQVKNNASFQIEKTSIILDDAIINLNHLIFLNESSSLLMNVNL